MATSKAIDFEFSDSADYAENASATNVMEHATAFTCEAWVRPENDNSAFEMFIDNGGHDNGSNWSCAIEWNGNDKFLFTMRSLGAWKHLYGNSTLTPGTWYHYAAVWDGSEQRLYVDGVKQTATFTFASHEINNGTAPTWAVGAWAAKSGSPTYWFDGTLDELRVSDSVRYTSNFTPTTTPFTDDGNVLALYHFNDDATDDGPNSYDLTESGTPTYVTGKVDEPASSFTPKAIMF